MRGVTIIVFSILFVFTFQNDDTCDHIGKLLYDELKCKPVLDTEGSCPKSYECPDYQLSKEYCNYQGKQIKVLVPLGQKAGCNIGCFCSNRKETHAEFTCAIVDCAEYFGPPISSNCYRTQSLEACCSVGQICPVEGEIVPTCTVDGRTVNETQIFRPKNTCMSCLCTKDFVEGKYEESDNCQKRVCASEIRYSEKIANNCAPVYYKYEGDEALCCPSDYICADETEDKINPSTSTDNADLKCKYGDKTLNYKDSFTRQLNQYGKTRELKCSCDLPPLVTCTAEI